MVVWNDSEQIMLHMRYLGAFAVIIALAIGITAIVSGVLSNASADRNLIVSCALRASIARKLHYWCLQLV